MIRIILIFLAIIIVLTAAKKFLRRYRDLTAPKSNASPQVRKNSVSRDDDIVDAKFEEIK